MARSESLAQQASRLAGEVASAADPGPVLERLRLVTAAVAAEERIAAVDAEIAALQREREGLVETVGRVQPSRPRRSRS